MWARWGWISLLLLALAAGRAAAEERFGFRFERDSLGWIGGFADLPAAELAGELFDLRFRRGPLPPPFKGKGLLLAGSNRSDDLFMYVKRQITGLRPDTAHRLTLSVDLLTEAGRGCLGIGGAPGESVHVKAGAVPFEPRVRRDRAGDLRLNLDKGQQSRSGRDAVVIGDLAADGARCGGGVWARKRLVAPERLVRSDRDGNLWLLLGTDSGYEGRTEVWIEAVRVSLVPAGG